MYYIQEQGYNIQNLSSVFNKGSKIEDEEHGIPKRNDTKFSEMKIVGSREKHAEALYLLVLFLLFLNHLLMALIKKRILA